MNTGNGDVEKAIFGNQKHELQKIGQTNGISAFKTPPSMLETRSISRAQISFAIESGSPKLK